MIDNLAHVVILLFIFNTATSIDQESRRLTTLDFIQNPFGSFISTIEIAEDSFDVEFDC